MRDKVRRSRGELSIRKHRDCDSERLKKISSMPFTSLMTICAAFFAAFRAERRKKASPGGEEVLVGASHLRFFFLFPLRLLLLVPPVSLRLEKRVNLSRFVYVLFACLILHNNKTEQMEKISRIRSVIDFFSS